MMKRMQPELADLRCVPAGVAQDRCMVVIDTNVALDLLVFRDPRAAALKGALGTGGLRWLATPYMKAEFNRVLHYPHIARRVAHHGLAVDALMDEYAGATEVCPEAPRAPVVCRDADDQPYVNLAVAHRACLLSHDGAVRALRRRLAPMGVQVLTAWPVAAACREQA
jgi:predicted nucleic acid-binding protein